MKKFNIRTFNKISPLGLKEFPENSYDISDSSGNPDAILLRSENLHEYDFPENVLAVGRAGAGVNNVPVQTLTERGIVVFNTPGANANAVKELVLLGMLLAARNVMEAFDFVTSIKDEDNIGPLVEDNKSKFKGFELSGKRLAVVGLGAIGMKVANDAVELGLDVSGFDPYLSVDRAWGLSTKVKPATSLEKMLSQADFVTFHMPLTDNTRGMVNKQLLSHFKKGAVLLNFSRGEIVDEDAVLESIETGRLRRYVCDFPTKKVINNSSVITIPHLGASTKEAEDNCAVMVVKQVRDYLENGNIINSVNFPNAYLDRTTEHRILIGTKNVPNMIGQISSCLAEDGLNIAEMINKSRGEYAYNILDISTKPSTSALKKITQIDDVVFTRVL